MIGQKVAGFAQAPAVPTEAIRRALECAPNDGARADLMFLEQWERWPSPGAAAALRINQIRRANPALAAEIRAEISLGRPLTTQERQALPG